ncbi:MAG: amidase [Pseudomonadota bacterium]
MTPAWAQSVTELAAGVRSGTQTSAALVDTFTSRIEALDGTLTSFVALNPKAAYDAAAADDAVAAGASVGPLHGVPIAIKDNYATADLPTRAGSVVDPGVPLSDSNAVSKLRAAGAVVLGKTRMHEYAWGMETPPCRNPFDTERVPGGSSGGSGAAVAAGLAPAALGSDTGGSIRMPASLCGTVGLKPTFGLIGRSGIVPHSWSLDHAGPLTMSVADAALLTAVMSGPDPDDPATDGRPLSYAACETAMAMGPKGLRIGVCRNHFFETITDGVAETVEATIDALAAAGATVHEFNVPELSVGLGAIFAIELASSAAYHDERLRTGKVASFEDDVRLLVEMGRFVSAADYLQAERYRRLLGERFAEVFEEVDVVVSPTMPLTAWRTDERSVEIQGVSESILAAAWRLTYPFNLLGLPALSVPCGMAEGLPVGVQIAGAPFDEPAVLRAGAAVESLMGPAPRPQIAHI